MTSGGPVQSGSRCVRAFPRLAPPSHSAHISISPHLLLLAGGDLPLGRTLPGVHFGSDHQRAPTLLQHLPRLQQ